MAGEIKIVKYKIRRGTNAQRKSIILDQGELAYTTDTQRLYVGNGVLSGGNSPTSRIHSPLTNVSSLTSVNAEQNDIAIANNIFYQLTGTNSSILSSWANIGAKLNPQHFQYTSDNSITVKLSGLSASNIDPVTISNGLKIANGILQTDYITKSLNISASKLTVKQSGIDEWEIASSTFTNGITGGNNLKIGLSVDPSYFYFSSGRLSLSSIPVGSLTFTSLDPSWIGTGLIYNGVDQRIDAKLTNVDEVTLTKDLSGVISVVPGLYMSNSWIGNGLTYDGSESFSADLVDVDNNTLVKDLSGIISIAPNQFTESIFTVLTGLSASNSTSVLSALFTGDPRQNITGGLPGFNITTFTVISSNGTTSQNLTLSSAGFITYAGATTTDGNTIGRYAIPIFAY